MKAEIGDIWYRVEDYYGAGTPLRPYERVLYVVKVTPAGVRLCEQQVPQGYHKPKFVLYPEQPRGGALGDLEDGGRRYAYPTLKMARWSWLYRKKRQLRIAESLAQELRGILADHEECGEEFWQRSPSRDYVFELTGA
jgi:hypothetical protein